MANGHAAIHMKRPSMTLMSWEGLSCPDDDDEFYETNNRLSTMVPMDLSADSSSSSDYEDGVDYDESRMSFSSTMSSAIPFGRPVNNHAAASPIGHNHHQGMDEAQSQAQAQAQPEDHQYSSSSSTTTTSTALPSMRNYDVWMTAPISIQERRKQLLRGMGLNSRKDLTRLTTLRALSKKFQDEPRHDHHHHENPSDLVVDPGTSTVDDDDDDDDHQNDPQSVAVSSPSPQNNIPQSGDHHHHHHQLEVAEAASEMTPSPEWSSRSPMVLSRSRSDGDLGSHSFDTKQRKVELIGNDISKQSLTRTSSTLSPYGGLCRRVSSITPNMMLPRSVSKGESSTVKKKIEMNGPDLSSSSSTNGGGQSQNLAAFFLIKNLDTGKEFVVKEYDQHGMWNRVRDLSTGKHLTMEEFEKSVGHSPVVKELMRRERKSTVGGIIERRMSVKKLTAKSFRYSKKRGASLLKTIKGKANSMTSEQQQQQQQQNKQQQDQLAVGDEGEFSPSSPNYKQKIGEWIKVKQQGRPYKELTALRMCQEITAHQGSIWTMKFNSDGRYLGSAGEDRVIHVWEVQECEIAALMPQDEITSEMGRSASVSSSSSSSSSVLPPAPFTDKNSKKKGKSGGNKKGTTSNIPDYVQLPETVFGLSEKPVCSFTGHQDDVLDLCWSTTQLLLLSSSMDKTVRLWDLESQSCLKLFAHNDYVTCIQFNPVSDDYFISGSLDAKLRIWNVTGRRVVDWDDLHEMVTAACFSPDGQTAAVGSHKGSCRMYSTKDGKLTQVGSFEIPVKKKKLAKITGLKFMPNNPSEVLVTSADSRIRIYDGADLIHKIKGFRNTSSQIAASCAPLGEHIVSASEDSNVYIWKLDQEPPRHNNSTNNGNKNSVKTRSFEHFHCKDVSVAIPWPGTIKFEPPIIPVPTKRHTKRTTVGSSPVSVTGSPTKSETNITTTNNSKRISLLPPLPKRNHSPKMDSTSITPQENINPHQINDDPTTPTSPELEPAPSGSIAAEASISNSIGSGPSLRRGDSPSTISHSSTPSWASGWSWIDGFHNNGGGEDTMQATAWGLVIVTAGLGGEIRAYQNFGLPVRVSRQGNLFS